MPFRPLLALSITAAALMPAAALAQVSATQAVVMERVSVGADGRTQIERAPAERVIPGDRIAYVLTYRNEGQDAAEDLVLVMPVPETMTVVAGSEEGGAADYSIDGGRTWGPFSALRVPAEEGGIRPAVADDVTHLRWTLADRLAPGQAGEVSYRATLR